MKQIQMKDFLDHVQDKVLNMVKKNTFSVIQDAPNSVKSRPTRGYCCELTLAHDVI